MKKTPVRKTDTAGIIALRNERLFILALISLEHRRESVEDFKNNWKINIKVTKDFTI